MSESGDYDPGPWKGHSFSDAKATYASKIDADRTYGASRMATKKLSEVCPPRLNTNSSAPLVIAVDVTGSMGQWPQTIFSKLGYLVHEVKTYLGPDAEICFTATGDAHCDKFPLQVQPFGQDTNLINCLEQLLVEGGGGGGCHETYELTALYFARNVTMPNARKPIYIFIGDERPYDVVTCSDAAEYGIAIQDNMTVQDVFKELSRKFSVYMIRKPYAGEDVAGVWAKILDEGHIAVLEDPERVVDVIFGILAKETGRIDEFKKEIEGRQTAPQVKTVYTALKTVHKLPPVTRVKALPGHSVLHNGPGPSKKTKDLM